MRYSSQGIRWAACIAVFGAALTCFAVPVPIVAIEYLVRQSDLIVVGTIAEIGQVGTTSISTPNGEVTAKILRATVEVSKTLKGELPGRTITFDFNLPDRYIGYRGLTRSAYRIIFLTKSEDGFSLTSPFSPSLIAVPDSSGEREKEPLQPFDAVLSNVASVLSSRVASIQMKREALYTLNGVASPIVLPELRIATHDSDPGVRLNAVADLLRVGDISTLPVAESFLLKPTSSNSDFTKTNLCAAIATGVRSEKAIESLMNLLSSPDVQVRRAVASALRNIGSRGSIPGLVKGLYDSDEEVRYICVAGLADITGESAWAANREEFAKNAGRYINHWREWAKQNSFF